MRLLTLHVATRAKAAEAGLYARSDGTVIRIRKMNNGHLVNALLSAVARGEPKAVRGALAAEVVRRGLRGAALQEGERRGWR